MKKLLHILILALALTMLAAPALAEQPTATAYKATEPIVIDGNLDDWNTSSPIVINTEEQVIRDVSFWQGENDLSATVYVMWDEENLYLAADVNEDTPYGAIEMLPLDGEDNFKVYISTDPAADPARTSYGTNDFLLYLIVDNNYWDTAFDRTMVEKDLLVKLHPVLPEHIAVKMVDFANEIRKQFIGASDAYTDTIEVTLSTRTLLRWADLTLRFQPLAHQGIQPLSYALDRALGFRASRPTRAMLHELLQRMFPMDCHLGE